MLVDQFFLAVYIMELTLKLYVWRLKFFKVSWNVFGEMGIHIDLLDVYFHMHSFSWLTINSIVDFAIVVASMIDFIIPLIVQNIGAFDARVFRVLRVFRAIRALRALRVIRTIRYVILSQCIMYTVCVYCVVTLLMSFRFLKNLQIIVSTVLQSIPAMGSIVMLISLVLCIFYFLYTNMRTYTCTFMWRLQCYFLQVE